MNENSPLVLAYDVVRKEHPLRPGREFFLLLRRKSYGKVANLAFFVALFSRLFAKENANIDEGCFGCRLHLVKLAITTKTLFDA